MKLYDQVDPGLLAPTALAACQSWEPCTMLDRHEGGCAQVGSSGLVLALPDPEEAEAMEAGISDEELKAIRRMECAFEEVESAKDNLSWILREVAQDHPDTRLAAFADALDLDGGADGTPVTEANGAYWAGVLAEYEDR